MNIFQHPILLNSFYYPNYAFLFLLFALVFQIAIIIVPIIIIAKYRRAILSWISKDYVFSMLIVLLVVVISRIVVMFFNSSHIQILPENIFVMNMVGRDWLDGVMQPIMRLWQGLPFDPKIGYGQGLSVFLGTLLYPLFKTGICSSDTLINCSQTGYLIMSATVLISYFVIICCLFKSSIRNLLLVGFITFILGYVGSLGLERGNTDILFSLTILMLYLSRKNRTKYSWVYLCVEGCVLGLLSSSKITILPLALAFIITSPRLISSVLHFIFWYSIWSLAPFAFGIQSSLLDSYIAGTTFQTMYFSDTLLASCWAGNHVLFGLASLFIPCSLIKMNIFNRLFLAMEYFIYSLLFVGVFIVPVIPLLIRLKMMNRKAFSYIKYVYQNRKEFILILIALAVAAINLLPIFSFSYRLYYSFAVLLAAWHSIQSMRGRKLLLLSTICFLLKGFWFTDLKILNVFIALHYMILIYASSMELRLNLAVRKDFYGSKKK